MFETVSIVIPIYNEAKTLDMILEAVNHAPVVGMKREIVLVDDYSQDGSREILGRYRDSHKVLYHDRNQGKGAALRTGFRHATGDIIIIQDADLEYDPAEYETLLKPILNGKADVVFGSRFLTGLPHRVLYYWHFVANSFLSQLSNMLSNLNLSDIETCYKVMRKEVLAEILPKLKSNRFGIEPADRPHRPIGPAGQVPRLRGGNLLFGADLRRGEENRLEGRVFSAVVHFTVQPVRLTKAEALQDKD